MTQEKLAIIDVQSFRSWERLLSREAKVARTLCVLTWCEGLQEAVLDLRALARHTHMRPRSVEEALRSLYEQGALSRLQYLAPEGPVIVGLAWRWRMEASP